MKILLLGASGMIGNGVYKIFSSQRLNTIATVSSMRKVQTLQGSNILSFAVTVNPLDDVTRLIKKVKPTHVVNCIGMIKPNDDMNTIKNLYRMNAIFPQVLSRVSDTYGIRCIHMSTDCVFSGTRGHYSESDIPDDTTEYGKSKFLGEMVRLPHVTIRTSIIGRELDSQKNLLDWFLHTKEPQISGYTHALWNGVTSLCIGRIIARIITKDIQFNTPIVHVAGDTISKYELLCLFKEIFHKQITIIKDDTYNNDKTLVPHIKQFELFNDIMPSMREQLHELQKQYV